MAQAFVSIMVDVNKGEKKVHWTVYSGNGQIT